MAIRKFPQSQIIPTPTYLEEIRAKTVAGLRITDFSGNLGIFVEDGGNIGIDLLNPTFKLDVWGSTRTQGFRVDSNVMPTVGEGMEVQYRSDIHVGFLAAYSRATSTFQKLSLNASDINFRIDSWTTNAMILDSSGRLGIGTDTPSDKLHINVPVTGNSKIVFSEADIDQFSFYYYGASAPNRLFIRNEVSPANIMSFLTLNNYVGIGTDAPAYRLDINGGFANPENITIHDENDLPAPVGGKITFAGGKIYRFPGPAYPLTITDDIDVEQGAIFERAYINHSKPINIVGTAATTTLDGEYVYSGTGAAIRAADFGSGIVRIEKMKIQATDATGIGFDFSTTNPLGLVVGTEIAIIQAAGGLGNFTGCKVSLDRLQGFNFGNGFKFNNCYAGVAINVCEISTGLNISGCRFIDVQGVCAQILIENLVPKPKSNEKIFYLNPSSYDSITVGISPVSLSESGVTTDNIFDTGSLTQKDTKVKFSGNLFVADSTATIQSKMNGNTNYTTLTVQDVWTFPTVPSSSYSYTVDERMSIASANGTMTYSGVETIVLKADMDVTLEPISTNKDCYATCFRIGSVDYGVTFDNTTNTISMVSGSPPPNDSTITFYFSAGTPPAALDKKYASYFVVNSGTTFQISYTQGGAAIAFTDDGTPPNSFNYAVQTGSEPVKTLSAGTPDVLSVKAMVEADFGCRSKIAIKMDSSPVTNLRVNSEYRRYFK